MSCEEIGSRIKDLREKAGLTQADLAKEMHVSREAVNQWERGARDLKSGTIIDIAKFFNVSCDYLLQGIEANNIEPSKQYGLNNESLTHLHTLAEAAQNEINGWPQKELLAAINELLNGNADYTLQAIYTFLTTDFMRPRIAWPANIDLGDKESLVKSLNPTLAFQKRGADGSQSGYFSFPYEKAFEEAFLLHINQQLKHLKATMQQTKEERHAPHP